MMSNVQLKTGNSIAQEGIFILRSALLVACGFSGAESGKPRRLVIRDDEVAIPVGELKEKVRSFSRLGKDWDSYGARAIGPDVVVRAEKLIQAMGTAVQLRGIDWISPTISPVAAGGISFAWNTGHRRLLLRILPRLRTVEVTTRDAGGRPERRLMSSERASELVTWVLSGK